MDICHPYLLREQRCQGSGERDEECCRGSGNGGEKDAGKRQGRIDMSAIRSASR